MHAALASDNLSAGGQAERNDGHGRKVHAATEILANRQTASSVRGRRAEKLVTPLLRIVLARSSMIASSKKVNRMPHCVGWVLRVAVRGYT